MAKGNDTLFSNPRLFFDQSVRNLWVSAYENEKYCILLSSFQWRCFRRRTSSSQTRRNLQSYEWFPIFIWISNGTPPYYRFLRTHHRGFHHTVKNFEKGKDSWLQGLRNTNPFIGHWLPLNCFLYVVLTRFLLRYTISSLDSSFNLFMYVVCEAVIALERNFIWFVYHSFAASPCQGPLQLLHFQS